MKLALIGHGAMGREHTEALLSLGGVTPQVVAGIQEDALHRFAQRYGFAHAVTDAEAALTDPQVDLVVIASPNHLHAAQARLAIEAGKHVLIEIPAATHLAGAEVLGRLSAATGVTVMTAHTSRYYPAVQDLRARIASGALHPLHVVAAMGTDKRHDRNFRGEARDWTDDLLWHHGLHVIDTAMLLFGEAAVEEVTVLPGQRHKAHGGEMDLAVALRFAGGGLATIALTYHANDQFTHYTVIAEEAFLDYRQGPAGSGPSDLTAGARFRDLVRQQDGDFLRACRDGVPSPIPVSAVLPAHRVLGRVQRLLDDRTATTGAG